MRGLLVTAACSAWAQLNGWAQSNEALQSALEQQRASAQVQREAVRKQAELAGPGPLRHTLPPAAWAPPPCDPIPDAAVTPLVEAAVKAHQLDATLVRAIIQQESSFYPCAISVHGAKGLMQLMPAAIEQLKVTDPFDPKQNIEAGTRYLKQLFDKYQGDLPRALSAYRIGPTVVDSTNGVPDLPEVRSYVDAILRSVPTPPAPPRSPMPRPTGN
jgi:soluble lytic murein transglycosylase-like protein